MKFTDYPWESCLVVYLIVSLILHGLFKLTNSTPLILRSPDLRQFLSKFYQQSTFVGPTSVSLFLTLMDTVCIGVCVTVVSAVVDIGNWFTWKFEWFQMKMSFKRSVQSNSLHFTVTIMINKCRMLFLPSTSMSISTPI